MIIISLKNNSKYAQIIERKFAKKEKKERKIIALLPKILHIVLHGKLEKINEYVLYVKKESNMQINIDNYVKLLSIFFSFISFEKYLSKLTTLFKEQPFFSKFIFDLYKAKIITSEREKLLAE